MSDRKVLHPLSDEERESLLELKGLDKNMEPFTASDAEKTANAIARGEVMPEVPESKPPEVSPTGAPVIPAKYVPHGLAVLAVLGAVAAAPTMGISLIPVAVAHGAMLAALILGPLLGVVSPGLRKK